MDPRTPHSLSRVVDPDRADINDLERVCHAIAARQEFLPAGVVCKKSSPELLRGCLRETAILKSGALAAKQGRNESCRANADDWEEGRRFRHRNRDVADVGNFGSSFRAAGACCFSGELPAPELVGRGHRREHSKRGRTIDWRARVSPGQVPQARIVGGSCEWSGRADQRGGKRPSGRLKGRRRHDRAKIVNRKKIARINGLIDRHVSGVIPLEIGRGARDRVQSRDNVATRDENSQPK